MELFNNDLYRYIIVCFGGLFLVPQIIHGYRTESLKDLSSISLFFIIIISSFWTYYMYKIKYIYYTYITGFVCLNAIILILMQLHNYYKRFKLHVKTFEKKELIRNDALPQNSIILKMPENISPSNILEEINVVIDDIKTEPIALCN